MTQRCVQCGACCQHIAIVQGGLTPVEYEWIIARGCIVVGEFILIPHRCQHLREDNTCDIHDTDKYPRACRDFHGQMRGPRGARYYVPERCSLRK